MSDTDDDSLKKKQKKKQIFKLFTFIFLLTARGFLNNPDKAVIFFHVGSLVVFTSPLGFLGFFRSSVRLFLLFRRIGSLVGH